MNFLFLIRYERSFSPPRSSNSSGYGTGSSSKSSASVDRFANIEGTLTSSSSGHSLDDRWYEVLESGVEGGEGTSPPPPLPVRLNNPYIHPAHPTNSHSKVSTLIMNKSRNSSLLSLKINKNIHLFI